MFDRLITVFGPQGWWPVTPSGGTRPVYTPGKSLRRRSEQDMFEICLGALLTQNTSWDNVVAVLSLLKAGDLLSMKALKRQPTAKLERLLRSSGYFRQKTRRVKNFLDFVAERHGGSFKALFHGPVGRLRSGLLSLHGIGPETADSMLLYAGGKPIFVVDAYTRRIGERWGVVGPGISYDAIQRVFMAGTTPSPARFGEYHALLVRLAKEFCRKKPVCLACPVRRWCVTGKKAR